MTTNHDALREAFNAFLLEQHERHKHQHNHFHVARNEWARRTQSTQYEALAASKPEPQAHAGEPKPLYEVDTYGRLQAIKPHSVSPGDKFITLQSHREAFEVVRRVNIEAKHMWDMLKADYDAQREALAQHRAALEECVRQLVWEVGSERQMWDEKTAAAITHANQVLKGGGK